MGGERATKEGGGGGGWHFPATDAHTRPLARPVVRTSCHHIFILSITTKLDTASTAEAADAARCVARLHHLLEAGGAQPPAQGGGRKAADKAATSGQGGGRGPAASQQPPAAACDDLASAPPPPPTTDPATSAIAWAATRMDRLIADDLLRRGRAAAAAALREEGEGGGGAAPPLPPHTPTPLSALVDWGVWEGAAPALAGLAARDATPALAWCAAHGARLGKLRSPLEFKLRLQEVVELVRAGDAMGALHHARAHLAPWACPGGRGGAGAPGFLADLQRAAGLAAFAGRAGGRVGGGGGGEGQPAPPGAGVAPPPPPPPPAPPLPRPYAALLADARWEDVAAALRRDVCRLAGAPAGRSPLEGAAQAGLAALKPPPGAPRPSSRDDPLGPGPACLGSLASPLPHAKRLHSRLLCGLSGRLMDGDNPPAALPSGAVYSAAALRARAGPGGTLADPETGERVRVSELRRVYIS